MTSTAAPDTSEVQPDADAPAPKKRWRLNPARRKAAKARAETKAQRNTVEATKETPNQQTVAEKAVVKPTQPSAAIEATKETAKQQFVAEKAVVKPTQPNQAKAKPPAPTPLQRQNTEPPTSNQKQIVVKAPPEVKPNLTRTKTAPPSTSSPKSTLALTAPALVTGGLVGCAAGAAILLGVGIWYDFSGAEQAILAARAAKLCVDNLSEEIIASLKAGTYSADEALDMLRRTTLAYASTIPEGAPFVERVFREIDTVRKQRGREIDKVVAETYGELQKAGRRGASSAEMRTIVVGQLMKLSSFASRATQDIVTRNPNLRPYREGASKALQGPPESKVPTVRLNMAVRQKQTTGG